MAVVDRRSSIDSPYRQGSSRLAVGLTSTQVGDLLENASDAAWYTIGELQGGEIGPDRDIDEVTNEAGEQVAQVTTREEFIVGNTIQTTDTETMELLTGLEDLYVPARYPLPAGTDGSGSDMHQLWYFPHVTVMKEDWRLNTDNAVRTREFTFKAVKREGDPVYAVATVDLTDSTNWPDEVSGAADDQFSAA
jgi:hypothetical protein